MRSLIGAMLPQQKSDESVAVLEQLLSIDRVFNSLILMGYFPMDDEVQILPLLDRFLEQKELLLPSIVGDDIVVKRYLGSEVLLLGNRYDIPEPQGDAIEAIPDVIIVPGVAFDQYGGRMGRGAGYYDRFLKRYPNSLKVGVAFECQMVPKVIEEAHDIKMDIIVSPSQIYKIK